MTGVQPNPGAVERSSSMSPTRQVPALLLVVWGAGCSEAQFDEADQPVVHPVASVQPPHAPPVQAAPSGALQPSTIVEGGSERQMPAPSGAGDAGMTTVRPTKVNTTDAGLPTPFGDARSDDGYPDLAAELVGKPTLLASGLALAESPLWDPCEQRLRFVDVMGNDGSGTLHALSATNEVETLVSGTDNANGIAYDIDGSLVLAQMGGHVGRLLKDGRIERIDPDGSPALHTPDDIVVRSDGLIYFSDGDFYPLGSLLGFRQQLPVFSLAKGASELVEQARVSGPNGIELSPDESLLYVSEYGSGTISRFEVDADGSLGERTALIRGLSNSDSLCLDLAGNLYIGTRAGLAIYRPDGSQITSIALPGGSSTKGTTNCTFGGEDGTTLFITTYTSLYAVDSMPIPGLDFRVAKARAVCD